MTLDIAPSTIEGGILSAVGNAAMLRSVRSRFAGFTAAGASRDATVTETAPESPAFAEVPGTATC
jgi:hypothetical protein